MKPLLLTLALLPGCSLLFQPAEPDEELAGADAGADALREPDAAPGASDSAPDASPPPVWTCDPFVEAACYVGNDPLAGPDFYPQGSGAQCASCEQSSDCQPGLFCTGYTDSPGSCKPLCDTLHPCSEGSCLGVQYQGFGFCPGSC